MEGGAWKLRKHICSRLEDYRIELPLFLVLFGAPFGDCVGLQMSPAHGGQRETEERVKPLDC